MTSRPTRGTPDRTPGSTPGSTLDHTPGHTPARPTARWILVGAVAAAVVALAVVLPLDSRVSKGTSSVARSITTPAGTVPRFAAHPTTEQAALLDQAVGFGSGVTGGAGGRVVRVTSDRDSGPGSLREAVKGGERTWVVLDRDLTIRIRTPIVVGSNTTIDGRGHRVVLTGEGRTLSGLVIRDVHNVLVESLILTGYGARAPADLSDPSDGILLRDAVGVWIDHVDLSRVADKGIVLLGARGVTLSWSHFHDQREVLQIGNLKTRKASAASTVTIHHNFFDRDGLRMPEAAYARVHVFANYYLDWRELAVRSSRRSQVLLEGNLFEGRTSRTVSRTVAAGNGCNSDMTRCDASHGALRASGNRVDGADRPVAERPAAVFDPSRFYPYDAPAATPVLATVIRAAAGPVS